MAAGPAAEVLVTVTLPDGAAERARSAAEEAAEAGHPWEIVQQVARDVIGREMIVGVVGGIRRRIEAPL